MTMCFGGMPSQLSSCPEAKPEHAWLWQNADAWGHPRTTESGLQSSESAENVVVNHPTVELEHLPRTNDHEVAQYRVVVLEVPEANHGVVHDHKVELEEDAARKRLRESHGWLRSR